MAEFELVATCLFGLEKLLGAEIDALGLRRTDTMDGRVSFMGGGLDVARANINLRTAERVYIRLGSFPARSFEELFEGTKALPWERFIGGSDAFPVKGHSVKSELFSIPDCQRIIKKAVADRLGAKYSTSWLEESGVKYQIVFFIFKDVASLMIDTSGVALHKRGYRPEAGLAPLRETLAAALAMTARPREDVLLWDPFCGSGTIIIEAAMLMLGKAPGVGRSFAGESFAALPSDLWREAREAALATPVPAPGFEAWGSDIDGPVLRLAEENARRAGVRENIKLFNVDARRIKKPDRRGSIVTNPPYGERMLEISEAEQIYREIGKNFADFGAWQIYILSASDNFERLYGRRADKVRKLYNGMIPCNLYQFFRPADAPPAGGRGGDSRKSGDAAQANRRYKPQK